MHPLDYNELIQNEDLWSNEEAVLTGLVSFNKSINDLEANIQSALSQKAALEVKALELKERLIELATSEKSNQRALTLIDEGLDILDPSLKEAILGIGKK